LPLVPEADDCTIMVTSSTQRSFDMQPLSPVSDHDLMGANMTTLDHDVVPDVSFDIKARDIVIPETHEELSMLDKPPAYITPDDIEPVTFDFIEGSTKRGKSKIQKIATQEIQTITSKDILLLALFHKW